MGYNTLALGLTLTIPTSGTRNWGSQLYNTTWTKISSHDHTGGGNGNQIGTTAIANGSVTSAKLAPNQALTQYSYTLIGSSPSLTVDFSNGNIIIIDASAATGTINLGFSNAKQAGFYRIYFLNNSPAATITFPATVRWPQQQAPILTPSQYDKFDLYYNGTEYFGEWEPNF